MFLRSLWSFERLYPKQLSEGPAGLFRGDGIDSPLICSDRTPMRVSDKKDTKYPQFLLTMSSPPYNSPSSPNNTHVAYIEFWSDCKIV